MGAHPIDAALERRSPLPHLPLTFGSPSSNPLRPSLARIHSFSLCVASNGTVTFRNDGSSPNLGHLLALHLRHWTRMYCNARPPPQNLALEPCPRLTAPMLLLPSPLSRASGAFPAPENLFWQGLARSQPASLLACRHGCLSLLLLIVLLLRSSSLLLPGVSSLTKSTPSFAIFVHLLHWTRWLHLYILAVLGLP